MEHGTWNMEQGTKSKEQGEKIRASMKSLSIHEVVERWLLSVVEMSRDAECLTPKFSVNSVTHKVSVLKTQLVPIFGIALPHRACPKEHLDQQVDSTRTS